MIKVNSVNLSFNREGEINTVLEDISFHVEPQTSCAIIGPSGCGKTSLLFLLAGLLQPDSGTVSISGNPRCGTILQNYGLFPWKTVEQNIGLGLVLQKESKKIIETRITSLIDDMGLEGFSNHYPIELSGGMQQRVALARALAVEPQILFMDEPLSSLDALTRERLQNLIVDVWLSQKLTQVLVTHSIEEAVFLGQKIVVLSHRPAEVIHIVDNPDAGSQFYRQSEIFFQRCIELRRILENDHNG
jgi:ABC-type nitrate/sulfonate/bicarbonate transport system ATPase subunit